MTVEILHALFGDKVFGDMITRTFCLRLAKPIANVTTIRIFVIVNFVVFVLLRLEFFAPCTNFPNLKPLGFTYSSCEDAKSAK